VFIGKSTVEFRGDLWRQKTGVHGLVCGTVNPTFRHLSRTPTCDGQADRQTDGHRATVYTALA